jgi:protein-S-isoprenylcysteine O-methyltransferase Ste14
LAEVPRLGARGGGWVALQSALVFAIVVLGVRGPGWPDSVRWWLKGAAALLVFAGLVVALSAARSLGAGFTTFPAPAARGNLVVSGPYAVVRHPIYSGAILFLAGVALALSPWVLLGVAALAVLWALKARVEERLLAARYPDYAAYSERTRFRLVPFVY